MRRGDKDCTSGVLSLANKEPLTGMELGVDIVWEVIGKDCCDGSDCMVRERETSLRRSRYWFGCEGLSSTKNGDVGCDGGVSGHQGSEVLSSRGRDVDVIRVYGDIVMEWGEEEGIEKFLSDSR